MSIRTPAEIEKAQKNILAALPKGEKKAISIVELAAKLGVPRDTRLANDLVKLRNDGKAKTVGERSKMRYFK